MIGLAATTGGIASLPKSGRNRARIFFPSEPGFVSRAIASLASRRSNPLFQNGAAEVLNTAMAFEYDFAYEDDDKKWFKLRLASARFKSQHNSFFADRVLERNYFPPISKPRSYQDMTAARLQTAALKGKPVKPSPKVIAAPAGKAGAPMPAPSGGGLSKPERPSRRGWDPYYLGLGGAADPPHPQ